jgi:hypothetical protein
MPYSVNGNGPNKFVSRWLSKYDCLTTCCMSMEAQWRGHGGFGGFEPPTCLQDNSCDSHKTADKFFWELGRVPHYFASAYLKS